ncbi:DUF4046 domain-containing protein (plasmid) [Bacillus sp. JAS24-2]|uniref:DUF4046 domain-containing protein n=1 Tax=Bacillus sp. JAS24-2 TaxID=2217832 RepID=UPI0011EDE1BB|nr:DUF4046 domain-containing protein [Bacillus sp. JAS24-2]QEL82436.1 DUF4046 domain-containing protein [Bacillus sp. JAS24-2]
MAITIEEIYQEILDGRRKSFPPGTWSRDVDGQLKQRVTKYLIEEILKWNDEDIKEKWNQHLIQKFKLTSVMQSYRSSPYEMLNAAYPNRFEAWELKHTPRRFWTKEKSLEILKKIIEEKERLTEFQLLENYDLNWLIKNKLGWACSKYFHDSPYQMLNAAYPNRFKEWELKNVPKNFWTKEKSFMALRWWIEEKEKLTPTCLLNVYSREWLRERNLSTPLLKYWDSNIYQMLNETYPNRIREWELKRVPKEFWNNKERNIKIFKQIIKEKGMSQEDIKKHYSLKWIVNNGLRTPLMRFWSDSPYKLLNEAYPNQFKEWELKVAPNKFWEKGKAIKIIKDEIDKTEVSISQLLKMGVRKWMKQNKLTTPFNKYWKCSSSKMLKEIYPKEFEVESHKNRY